MCYIINKKGGTKNGINTMSRMQKRNLGQSKKLSKLRISYCIDFIVWSSSHKVFPCKSTNWIKRESKSLIVSQWENIMGRKQW